MQAGLSGNSTLLRMYVHVLNLIRNYAGRPQEQVGSGPTYRAGGVRGFENSNQWWLDCPALGHLWGAREPTFYQVESSSKADIS